MDLSGRLALGLTRDVLVLVPRIAVTGLWGSALHGETLREALILVSAVCFGRMVGFEVVVGLLRS